VRSKKQLSVGSVTALEFQGIQSFNFENPVAAGKEKLKAAEL
jgi:hypothetical protein